MIPAGSLIQCTISDPSLSSKTADIGDPVLCEVGYSGYSEQLGHSRLPYDSYLVGRFENYKDPGHFVGKGWMELKFERMVIEPNTVIPIHARVVGVHGYNVDRQGRILGKGHAVRDTVEWTIPILWPIDMINLPRRGPRPTLKAETQLTLKVMDDFGVPQTGEPQEVSPSLYRRTPSAYTPPPQEYQASEAPVYYPQVMPPPPSIYWYAAPPPVYAPPPWAAHSNVVHERPPYLGADNQEMVTLVFNDGRPPEQIQNYMLTPTTLYVLDGYRRVIPLNELDVEATREVNLQAGDDFRVPGPVPVYTP